MPTVATPHPARGPYRNIWIYFALLIPAAALAFAQSYFKGTSFSGLPVSTLVHAHMALMSLWLLMLIGQAWLIRTHRYRIHRVVGRSSLIIAPLIIIMTMVMAHETLNRKPEITIMDARLEIYTWGQTIAFGLVWALGILYRRRTPIHVRYMVSTAFAMGSAIVLRILLSWFAWVPGLGKGSVPDIERTAVANGAVLVILLLALIVLDWRHGIKCSPFWLVTILTVIMHVGFLMFSTSDLWMSFVQWYAGL